MKQKGFSAVEGLIVVLVLAIVGFGGWYIWDQNQDDDAGVASITSFDECVAAGNPVMESFPEQCTTEDGQTFTNDAQQEKQTPDGWVNHEIQDLGINFNYPEAWGDVQPARGDSETYRIMNFTEREGILIGGPRADYVIPARGGSLLDYSGFSLQDGILYELTLLNESDRVQTPDGYELSDSGDCAFNTDVIFFQSPSFHAICNVAGGNPPGVNFGASDTQTNEFGSQVTKAEFVDLVNSVQII